MKRAYLSINRIKRSDGMAICEYLRTDGAGEHDGSDLELRKPEVEV